MNQLPSLGHFELIWLLPSGEIKFSLLNQRYQEMFIG